MSSLYRVRVGCGFGLLLGQLPGQHQQCKDDRFLALLKAPLRLLFGQRAAPKNI